MTEAYFIDNPEFYDGGWWEHPIASRFLETSEKLEYSYHKGEQALTHAILNIKECLLDWVSAGLIAQWVTRNRLWQEKYATWKDFCIQALGKQPYKVKKLMEAAETVKYLAEIGLTILPTNQSQADKLVNCAKKLDCSWEEAWEKVVDTLPESLITADAIAETFGFAAQKSTIRIPIKTRDRLREIAVERGMSVEDMLIEDYELTESSEENNQEADELSEEKTEIVADEAIERWESDLEQLVKEHERQIWVQATLIKLAGLAKKVKSQFNFLVEHKLQLA